MSVKTGNLQPQLDLSENDDIDGISAKKVLIYGYDLAGATKRRIAVDANGKIDINATITTGDIEIGAVELKNATTDDRAIIDASGNLQTEVNNFPIATTITEYNITMTTVDTEYSQALPADTKAIGFQCRGAYDVRYAFTTGKVAGSTTPFQTLKAGTEASKDELDLIDKTLYVACATAGQILELIIWS